MFKKKYIIIQTSQILGENGGGAEVRCSTFTQVEELDEMDEAREWFKNCDRPDLYILLPIFAWVPENGKTLFEEFEETKCGTLDISPEALKLKEKMEQLNDQLKLK